MNRLRPTKADSLDRVVVVTGARAWHRGGSMPSWPPLQGPKSIVPNDMGGGIHGEEE